MQSDFKEGVFKNSVFLECIVSGVAIEVRGIQSSNVPHPPIICLSAHLMIEIYECTNYIGPAVLTEFFSIRETSYDLRIKNLLQIPKAKTYSFGQSSLSFRGSILWTTLSDSIKSAQNSKGFKTMTRNWKGESCSCIVCK